MLNSNFNLYKAEWLDLVFAGRNKEYGAYYIRQHYAGNMVKAMGITFSAVAVLALVAAIVLKPKPADIFKMTKVDLKIYVPPVTPKTKLPEKKALPAKASAPVKSLKYVPPVVTAEPVTEEVPTIEALKTEAVGSVEVKTGGQGTNVLPADGADSGSGITATPAPDENIYRGADIMPEPYGGAEAWAKFLQKNLRFPPAALDHNVGGRVIVTFVVEKDGHLSSLSIDRGAGFGMDEEALRVLKLAKAWKPGLQKGQPVRVKYTLPINFSLSEN